MNERDKLANVLAMRQALQHLADELRYPPPSTMTHAEIANFIMRAMAGLCVCGANNADESESLTPHCKWCVRW